MGLVLLDTDVSSFFIKKSSYAEPYLPLIQKQEVAVSFMTEAELYQWAYVRNWGKSRIKELTDYLDGLTIIYADQPMCCHWAKIRTEQRARGMVISPQDAWVAATALRYDLPLITNNIKDFQHIPCLNLLRA